MNEVYELFLDLDADESQIEFPIVYCNARAGRAGLTADPSSLGDDLRLLFDALLATIPAPSFEEGHPLQALVTNLDASPYVGRLAICRVHNGTIRKGQQIAWCRADGSVERARVTELYVTEALDRVDAAEAGPGEIVAVAGLPEVTIGETLADPDDARALPVVEVDEPSLAMTIGINSSPLAGQEGSKLTAPMVKQRLDQELVGNVSLRVAPTERPDAWEVQGRGELQLAVLVEPMRREGFELTVGKPQVVVREVDGKVHEPVERVSIDVPEEYVGVLTQLFALRKGRMENMVNHGTGWVRMDVLVPARGLIGFRTEFLTETRGTGILHHVFERYEPWHGDLRTRPSGSLVADRRGATTTFALLNLQERGSLFVGPGVEVYEGMVVGENARAEDLDVNATKEKKLTNIRSSTADELVRLIPPRPLSLEQALEFIRDDECVEVTPASIRLRKVELSASRRQQASSRKARGLRNVAIVAHVDHGKTTLVDAMLGQSGSFRENQDVAERVMDSMDLERVKGITILAKNTAVRHGGVKINIVDTPGHADFGGEVERALRMVDGVLLLVDASEGPLPQTRFVLRKALEARLPVVLVVNKIDRPDARATEVVNEVYELFLDLDADESQIEFPIVYCNARAGRAGLTADPSSLGDDLRLLFDALLATIPAPSFEEGHPLQALVTNLDASPYVGRLAICRVHNGTIRKGQQIAWCRADGSVERARVTELYVTEALDRVDAAEAGPGEIVAVAGLPEVTIGETLADPDDAEPSRWWRSTSRAWRSRSGSTPPRSPGRRARS